MPIQILKHITKYIRRDVVLEYTLWYKSASGRSCWTNGAVKFVLFEDPMDQLNAVLKYMTPFVNKNWFRLEIHTHGNCDHVLLALKTNETGELNEY